MASETTPHSPSTSYTPEHHDPDSSSSTLVSHGNGTSASNFVSTSPYSSTPASPFSASFDPNMPSPPAQQQALAMLALRDGPLHPMNQAQAQAQAQVRIPSAPATDANALWAHRLSASFGAIADQIAAASKALATVPESPPVDAAASGSGSGSYFSAAADGGRAEAAEAQKQQQLASRLDIIERTQERLGAELQEVQNQLALLQAGGRDSARGEKDQGEVTVVEVQEEGTSEFKSASEIAIEELQKKVEGAIDTIKLDQAWLYARLHNATVTTNKMQIKAPITANGKTPQNFPNTKGEFEHLTKERYEQILKAYNLPARGDTNAKRELLREFIGLTPPC